MDSQFLTEESFLVKIDEIVRRDGINHIEAIVHFCEENEIDVEDVKSLVGKSLSDRLKVDAVEYGYFKKQAQLPI